MEIDGSVSGDIVGGNKTVTQTAGGDIVGGDKLTHTGAGHIFAGSGNVTLVQPALSPASIRDRANLMQLHHKVRAFWIEGVLQRSVHSALLLELGREERVDAVDHPWASVLEVPEARQRRLPPDISDVQVFDEANRALLILGQPGSGKTTTLLEIARDLLARAEADPSQPIPVVFNLSSWSSQRQPLKAWLVAELSNKYQVPARLARNWLADHRLLPLLDGLDEVDVAWQAACVKAINDGLSEPGLPGIVVCCRLDEYTGLPVRLRFNAAICVTPLSAEQINAYLEAGGPGLAALRSVLNGDEVLAGLAQTPLFLSLMCLAYRDLPAEALVSPELTTTDHRRRHLFAHFVARMLKRKGSRPSYVDDARLLRWLNWLARQMSAHNLSIFLPERLQPSWIENARGRWAYALASRLGLWINLGCGLTVPFLLLAATLDPRDASWSAYLTSTLSSAAWLSRLSVFVGIAWLYSRLGLVAGLLAGVRFTLLARRGLAWSAPGRSFWRSARNLIALSVMPVSVAAMPQFLRAVTPPVEVPPLTPAGVILNWGLVMFAAAITQRNWETGAHLSNDIPNIAALAWSPPQSLRGGLIGFSLTAALMSACIWTIATNMDWLERLVGLIVCGLPAGLLGGLVFGALAGLRVRASVEAPWTVHWLIRQVRTLLTAGLLYGLVIGLPTFIFLVASFYALAVASGSLGASWQVFVPGLGAGLSLGLAGGFLAALYYGGASLIQRAVLRLVLIAQQRIPWRLSRIATQAEDLVFIRRVGSGYIFIHRLVQDYFASLPTK